MEEVKWAEEITWKEFADLLKETDVGIVPIGVLEVHGYHGPLGFDNYIAEEIAERLAKKVKSIVFPILKYGNNTTRYDCTMWLGTISISSETLANLYTEIGKELARQGIKRIVFVNGHYCNTPALEIAASRIWMETGVAVGILEWFMVARDEIRKISLWEPHADETETSMLLATKWARLVDLSKAVANPGVNVSEEEREWRTLLLGSKITHAEDERYLSKAGNYGDPRLATKEKGDRVIDVTVERGVKLIEALKAHVKK